MAAIKYQDVVHHIILKHPSVEYKITTVTKDSYGAGTDSDFYYTITGTKGKTAEYVTDNPGNDRQRGGKDTYTITDDTDIGNFRCVSIRAAGGDGWLFTEVPLEIQIKSHFMV
jgi:uncharacterized protein (UPF0248 family)